jgi:hypothetical protein
MNFLASISTSKNLTVLGIVMIIQALAAAAKAQFDGDPATVIDLVSLIKDLIAGGAFILAKGANSSGTLTPTPPA